MKRTLCGMGGLLVACGLNVLADCAPALADRIYFVGNSLTEQQYYGVNSLNAVGAPSGRAATSGLHTHGGVGLSAIVWAWTVNGFASYVEPSGYTSALATGTWDRIVLQPWQNSATTEVAAARHILSFDPNPLTPAYIYATFPARLDASGQYDAAAPTTIAAQWSAPYTNPAVSVQNTRSRAYFSSVTMSLRAQEPARPLFVIPVGDVFAEIETRIAEGTLTGMTAADLYSDAVHASFLGRYVVALTQASVLFQIDPRGDAVPAFFQSSVSPSLATQLQSIVWQTVSSQPLMTGVPTPSGAAIIALAGFAAARRHRRRG